jgi:squalene-associated FAD-dependent desaturase
MTPPSPTDPQRVITPKRKPPPPHVVIVGGGLAGLATAVALSGHELRLTLFESRPRLGGRASSFTDPATGELVDNCQHVSMACCTNLADFCRQVGTDGLFRRDAELLFIGPDGRTSVLKAGFLPAPMHLAGSFLRARYLSLPERLRVAYGLACLRFARPESETRSFEQWLLDHGQTTRTIERFWGTVLISALNELPGQMDVGHARKVFLDGFLRNRHGFEMELPTVPLGELYGLRMERWLAEHGVEARLTTGVRSIDVDPERSVEGVTLRDGTRIPADFVVSSVPFDRVRGFFSNEVLRDLPALDRVTAIESSPITGVHLWFDRPVCPVDHAVTVGRLVQWVFNHTAIQGRTAAAGAGQYLQIVISASYDLLKWDRSAIRDAVLRDLAELWPEVRQAELSRWWVVTEHGATFAVRPGIDALRPPQRTPIDGLFLAGDWTATGWPATMEGAVRSGYLAAEGVLEDLGRPERLVRPELPDGLLARLFLGPRRQATAGAALSNRDAPSRAQPP